MKKYFAVILTFILILTCFVACKPKLKDGLLITNNAGENYAAVTQADGGIVRDGAGNIVVLVTDEKGKNVKESGEYRTNAIAFNHALVIGNTIEMPNYSIQIPNGWSNSKSFNSLVLKKDGTADTLTLSTVEDKTVSEVAQERLSIIDVTKSNYQNTITDSKTLSFGDIDEAMFYSAFVPDAGNDNAVYLSYIVFEKAGTVYSCMINSNTDISASISEVTDILATINYIH